MENRKKAKWTPPKPPVPFSSRDDLSEMEIEGKVGNPSEVTTTGPRQSSMAPLNELLSNLTIHIKTQTPQKGRFQPFANLASIIFIWLAAAPSSRHARL